LSAGGYASEQVVPDPESNIQEPVTPATASPSDSPTSLPTAPPNKDQSSDQIPNPFQDRRDRVFYPGDTERWKPLATKLFANTLLDQKEIWTSPFHMHARDAKWWLGGAAITALLIGTDHQSSTIFRNSSGQVSWGNH